MGKGKNKAKNSGSMFEWSEDPSKTVDLEHLIIPLRRIFYEGYEIKRKSIFEFNYHGFNIGEEERKLYYPTPRERFSERWLKNELKFQRPLVDSILLTAVLLGVEQGRRLAHKKGYNKEILNGLLLNRNELIRKLKEKLSSHGVEMNVLMPLKNDDDEIFLKEEDEMNCITDNVSEDTNNTSTKAKE